VTSFSRASPDGAGAPALADGVAPPQIDHIQRRSANLDLISGLGKSTLEV
jgi:hypothetical protein